MPLSTNMWKDGWLKTFKPRSSCWEGRGDRRDLKPKQKLIIYRLVFVAAKSEIDSALADKSLRIF